MLSFLSPWFLAGLAVLAVPVIVHLANRPKKKPVQFPSLMFLERVEFQASSRRRLRHLVLFALRCLALIMVAAAFARPFVDRPDAPPVAVEGNREVVVLLDRSASMGVEDRMERARAAVADVAATLRRGDRATLVAFDHSASATIRPTDQPDVLERAAGQVEPGDGGTRFAPALRLAESILSSTPLPRRELVVVSDFQRGGWDPDAAPRMPAGATVRTVAVGAPVDNTAVADVQVTRERFSGRERARLRARVVNQGAAAVEVPVRLELEGRAVDEATVSVGSGDDAIVELGPVTLADRPTPITIRAGTDRLPLDNAHRVVLEANRGHRVLLVTSGDVSASQYLARALEVGGEHQVARVSANRLEPASLGGVDVVVMADADEPSARAVDALEEFVAGGHGLIAVLGGRSRAGWWADSGLLPGELRGTRDRGDDGGSLVSLQYDHPLLRPFAENPAGLTGARFYRYRELSPRDRADMVARFDDGAAAVVAAEMGAGRVVAVTAPLDGRWSDLVLQPAFVPLVHGAVGHAAGRAAAPASRVVGDLVQPATLARSVAAARQDVGDAERSGGGGQAWGAVAGSEGPVLLTPGGDRLRVEPRTLLRLDEVGFYELRDPGSTTPPPVLAVNPDPDESDLAMADAGQVREALQGGPPAQPVESFAPEDRERGQSLWWYALVAAFLIMVVEAGLANRLSPRRPIAGGVGA